MQISKLLDKLGENKKLQAEKYQAYKELREAEETMKAELLAEMRAAGSLSFKGERYIATISERKDIAITHEHSVMEWLEETPNIETDAYIGLKLNEFKTLAKQVLKETGEIIPGTDLVVKESLSVKGVK